LRRGAGLALLLAALPAFAGPVPAAAQGRGGWAAEDRILISDFSNIVGVASDDWRVYAATPNGLLTWDPASQAWGLPLTFEDGYPVPEQPSALAWSDAEQALVLGTRMGRLWRVDPAAGRADPLGAVPGPVEALLGGANGGLYVRTPSGWLELPAGSMVPRPVAPPAEAQGEADPRLRSLGGVLGLDEHLRRWPVTAVVPGPRPDEFYVGTAGAGLLHVDARTLQVTPLPYGATGRAVTALAAWRGRLWFAAWPPARGRSSLASADTSLQHWSWPDPQQLGAPAAEIAVLAVAGDRLWAGAGDGLYRLEGNGDAWQRFDVRDGLPSAAVVALATSDSTLWVGTRRGACLWRGAGCGPTLLPGSEVTALAYCGRTLWIGTDEGLFGATAAELVRAEPPGFSGRVQALACLNGALYVAGPRLLLVQENGSWRPPIALGGSGTVRTMMADDAAIWVGGDAGAARWDPAARAWSSYLVPGDVPAGPVLGVLPEGDRLWLATSAGALRLELRDR